MALVPFANAIGGLMYRATCTWWSITFLAIGPNLWPIYVGALFYSKTHFAHYLQATKHMGIQIFCIVHQGENTIKVAKVKVILTCGIHVLFSSPFFCIFHT
jgi:hypothetical protein